MKALYNIYKKNIKMLKKLLTIAKECANMKLNLREVVEKNSR